MSEFYRDHFPEDKDAPEFTSGMSFLRKFYYKNKKILDLIIFGSIMVSTILTFSFSVYIIIIKYLK